jgi:hypothetical protein
MTSMTSAAVVMTLNTTTDRGRSTEAMLANRPFVT